MVDRIGELFRTIVSLQPLFESDVQASPSDRAKLERMAIETTKYIEDLVKKQDDQYSHIITQQQQQEQSQQDQWNGNNHSSSSSTSSSSLLGILKTMIQRQQTNNNSYTAQNYTQASLEGTFQLLESFLMSLDQSIEEMKQWNNDHLQVQQELYDTLKNQIQQEVETENNSYVLQMDEFQTNKQAECHRWVQDLILTYLPPIQEWMNHVKDHIELLEAHILPKIKIYPSQRLLIELKETLFSIPSFMTTDDNKHDGIPLDACREWKFQLLKIEKLYGQYIQFLKLDLIPKLQSQHISIWKENLKVKTTEWFQATKLFKTSHAQLDKLKQKQHFIMESVASKKQDHSEGTMKVIEDLQLQVKQLEPNDNKQELLCNQLNNQMIDLKQSIEDAHHIIYDIPSLEGFKELVGKMMMDCMDLVEPMVNNHLIEETKLTGQHQEMIARIKTKYVTEFQEDSKHTDDELVADIHNKNCMLPVLMKWKTMKPKIQIKLDHLKRLEIFSKSDWANINLEETQLFIQYVFAKTTKEHLQKYWELVSSIST